MFRMIVLGKTVSELRTNMMAMALSITPQNDIDIDNAITRAGHAKDDSVHLKLSPEQQAFKEANRKKVEVQNDMPAPPALPPMPAAPLAPSPSMSLPVSQHHSLPTSPVGLPAIAAESQAASTERDSRGVPWDASIHASSKATNKDGTWRGRRGVEANEIKAREAQLLAASPMSAPSFAPPAPPALPSVPSLPPQQQAAPASPFGAPPAFQAPQAVAQMEPPIAASPFTAPPAFALPPHLSVVQPVAPAPVQEPQFIQIPPGTRPAYSLEDFKKNLLPLFAHLVNEKKVTQDYVEQLKKHYNLKEIWLAADHPAIAQELFDGFANYGWITKV